MLLRAILLILMGMLSWLGVLFLSAVDQVIPKVKVKKHKFKTWFSPTTITIIDLKRKLYS